MKEDGFGGLPRPQMRDEFRRELRATLMREAPAILARRSAVPRWLPQIMLSRPRLASVAAAAAVLLIVLTGTGVAAAGTLPGDALYGVKRAGEEVRYALTFDQLARVQVLAALTDVRVTELREVVVESRPDPVVVAASVTTSETVSRLVDIVAGLREVAADPRRDLVVTEVKVIVERERTVLEDLRPRLPAVALPAVDRAIRGMHELPQVAPVPAAPSPSPSVSPSASPSPSPTASPTRSPGTTPSPSRP